MKTSARARALLLAGLLACSTTGCTFLKVEWEHTSHPLAGPPFGPRNEEDSLDVAQVCLGREGEGRSRWYTEQCLGWKLADGGFYGPELTYSGRVGRRFDFKK